MGRKTAYSLIGFLDNRPSIEEWKLKHKIHELVESLWKHEIIGKSPTKYVNPDGLKLVAVIIFSQQLGIMLIIVKGHN